MISASRRMVEELGIMQGLLETEAFAGLIALIEPDAAAAEQRLRVAYEGFRHHGLAIDAARAAALLGIALLGQGRAAEAEVLSHESEALAGDDLQAAIAWRRVRAGALAQRGEHAAAVDFARAAVGLAATTDALLHHADARRALAAALRAAGAHAEAAAEEARAVELWETKGATVLAERARGGTSAVHQVDRASDGGGERVSLHIPPRVRPNAAVAHAVRILDAIAARDADAVAAQVADRSEVVDHTTGATYGRQGLLAGLYPQVTAQNVTTRIEGLATLGDSLALGRQWVWASGARGRTWDIGPLESESVQLIEIDGEGRRARTEMFAPNRLGDAVARLYERYAELLPDGPVRDRAAATARSVAAFFGPPDFDRYATAVGPEVEMVHHRGLVGQGSSRGRAAWLRVFCVIMETEADATNRTEDILGLTPEVCLVRRENSGTDRATVGAVEQTYLMLAVFGPDGLMVRNEWFAPCHEDEALARFDELVAAPAAVRPVQRRVRANAATARAARLDAAVAARDADALSAVFAPGGETLDHSTGSTSDGGGAIRSYRYLLRAEEPACCHEPLATLGDSLALFRQSTSARGFAGGTFDVGAYEKEILSLLEVDTQGRWRAEAFAVDHLGGAVVRLYERYAELLPEGAERARVAATARSVAAYVGPIELDRLTGSLAPAAQFVDHRILGTWSAWGAESAVQHWRSWLELVDVATRFEDVLVLRPDALLVPITWFGTDRAGGGAFELQTINLFAFGADGLMTRAEAFDAESAADALARFDELTSEPGPIEPPVGAPTKPVRRVRANAATAHAARGEAAIAARDAEAFAAMYADESETVDHTTGATLDRQGALSLLALLKADDPTLVREMLATLGDSLALWRQRMSASGFAGGTFDVGPYEREELILCDVNAQGRHRRSEVFAADHLGDAIVRLYERHAELLPDGPARRRATGIARSVALTLRPFDLDRYAETIEPAIEVVDHRILGTWSAGGAEEFLRHMRAMFDLAEGITVRYEDVLALEPDAFLASNIFCGTGRASGGAYEADLLALAMYGADGRHVRIEWFDRDRAAEALARFDELGPSSTEEGPPPAARAAAVENAATRGIDQFEDAWAAGDWERVAARFAPGFRLRDRRSYAHLDLDREQQLASLRFRFEMRSSRFRHEVLATRGHRLALVRARVNLDDGDVGPSESESLLVLESDEHGALVQIAFDPDALDAAYAELDSRYAAGEAATHGRAPESL
jgi:hypothetical protein